MAGAAGVYRTDRNATGVGAAYNQFKSQAQDVARLQFKLDMLREHHNPSPSLGARIVDAAVSVADPLGLGWIKSSLEDLSQGMSLGQENDTSAQPSSTEGMYLSATGELYRNGFQIKDPMIVQAYIQADREVQEILASGDPMKIEREMMRTARNLADYREVARGFESRGHMNVVNHVAGAAGAGTGSNNPNLPDLLQPKGPDGYNANPQVAIARGPAIGIA